MPLASSRKVALFFLVLLFTTLLQPFSQNTALAAPADIDAMNSRFYAGVFLRDCLYQLATKEVGGIKVGTPVGRGIVQTPDTMFAGTITPGYTGLDYLGVDVGRYYAPDSGTLKCNNNGAAVSKALNDFGMSAQDLFLSAGYKLDTVNSNGTSIPVYTLANSKLDFDSYLNKRLIQTDPAKYVELTSVFSANCQINIPPQDGDQVVVVRRAVKGDNNKYNSQDIQAGFPVKTVPVGNLGDTTTVNLGDTRVTKYDYNRGDTTCRDLLNRTNDLIASVVAYNNTHDTAIENGINQKSSEATDEEKTKITCTIEGIGWFMCPTLTFMARISDQAYGFLASTFLQVEPGMLDNAKDAWARFRDVANILFVIAFLIVVFSQLTSIGISNYGIKKMLPRIVVAAVLVNVSFLICQIAVDLSNILGYGVASFVDTAFKLTSPSDAATEAGVGFAAATATVLAVTAGIALALSIPVLISALLAIGLMVLILIGRKVIILLLVVVAPLAFVAYLLPNTEQWFKKWGKTFSTMLLLFPIVALVFAISKLAMEVLAVSAKDNPALQWASLGAGVVPFFAVPPLLKTSLNSIGKMGEKFGGMIDKRFSKVKSNINDNSLAGAYKKQWDRNQQIKDSQVLAGRYTGGNIVRMGLSSVNSAINKSRLTGSLGNKISAAGASTALALKNEDIENEIKLMQGDWQPHEELDRAEVAYADALKSNDVIKARAAQKVLLGKGGAGAARIRSVIQAGDFNSKSTAVRGAKSDLSAAGLKGKDAGLNAWSYDSAERSLKDVDNDGKTYTGLTDAELSSQTHGSIVRAANAPGGLSSARATAIMGNKDLHGNMTGDSKAVFEDVRLGTSVSANRDPDIDTVKGTTRRAATRLKPMGS